MFHSAEQLFDLLASFLALQQHKLQPCPPQRAVPTPEPVPTAVLPRALPMPQLRKAWHRTPPFTGESEIRLGRLCLGLSDHGLRRGLPGRLDLILSYRVIMYWRLGT